eukprot:scaffold3935_cov142-Skeletonema_menzelii.AAC.3
MPHTYQLSLCPHVLERRDRKHLYLCRAGHRCQLICQFSASLERYHWMLSKGKATQMNLKLEGGGATTNNHEMSTAYRVGELISPDNAIITTQHPISRAVAVRHDDAAGIQQ